MHPGETLSVVPILLSVARSRGSRLSAPLRFRAVSKACPNCEEPIPALPEVRPSAEGIREPATTDT
jgi:hypothetical protein